MRNTKKVIFFLCTFAASAAFFALLEWSPSFADPDSYYHAKVALLMAEQRGPIMAFPWLPLTSLADIFIDHHLLYHILLIPFVTAFDPLVGIKIAAVLFASGFVTFFAWILFQIFKELPQKFFLAGLGVVLLLTNHIFVSRMAIPKAGPLALALLFAALWCILKNRPIILGIVSFIAVWTHGSWPMILVASWLAWGVHAFSPGALREIKVPLVATLGVLAGLILNPYFPKNLEFYWIQIGKIAVANTASATRVGSEWYSLGLSTVPLNAVVLMLFIGALFVTFLRIQKLIKVYDRTQVPTTVFFGVFSLLLLALSVRSQRYLEYFVPVAVLFSLVSFAPLLDRLPQALQQWRAFFLSARDLSPYVLCAVIGIGYGVIIVTGFNVAHAVAIFHEDPYFPIADYHGAGEWIAQNIPTGSRIFHDRWDDFPALFYFSDRTTYISGLDPRFLTEKNPTLDKTFAEISTGTKPDVVERIIKDFGSEFVFTRIKRSALTLQLEKDKDAKKVYEDTGSAVYHLSTRPSAPDR
ncbi:MAG: hypothetical protein AAB416_00560 [Patescibacteria group bacterium]